MIVYESTNLKMKSKSRQCLGLTLVILKKIEKKGMLEGVKSKGMMTFCVVWRKGLKPRTMLTDRLDK